MFKHLTFIIFLKHVLQVTDNLRTRTVGFRRKNFGFLIPIPKIYKNFNGSIRCSSSCLKYEFLKYFRAKKAFIVTFSIKTEQKY